MFPLNEREVEVLKLAALGHDLGHLAFSHSMENLESKTHEERTIECFLKNSIEINEIFGYDITSSVLKFYENKNYNGNIDEVNIEKILSFRCLLIGDIDCDRMEYMTTDNFLVNGKKTDFIRILKHLSISYMDGKLRLVYDKKVLSIIINMLYDRYVLYDSMYYSAGLKLSEMIVKKYIELEKNGIEFSKEVKMSDVINILPFKLTKAQLRVLEEIDNDMESQRTMNRLLQGDVGSGKTVVAMISAYKAVKSGYQAAIMAPTAILASQHLEGFQSILSQFGIRCELLISSITKKKKTEILEKLQNGEIDILIGTHALLEENVVFKNLGLVVTDEQHRFGVKQRATIATKGKNPDTIAMSATPIPRTLALILYGDLDISIIDELPPNRKKIETFAVRKGMTERVNQFIRKQIDDGRQAYIVCPLVEENEELGLKSVIELEEKYKNETFSNYKVAYLHGKMKAKEKDEIMEKFKNGEIQILIATTVIEVGVNVPNASIMVVENAERFGLAQLHQLRGRVGRGEYQSYCILKFDGNSETIRQRMKVMCDTNDGFIISEKDLELRGSGDFFGTEQHGIPEFKIANLFEDMGTLKKVQKIAMQIMADDPLLEKEKNAKLNELIKSKFSSRIEI